jgi:putative endonuclease
MRGFVYILRCADGSYYVGSTTDIDTRIAMHQSGEGGDYTAQRLPLQVVYSQEFEDYQDAFAAERQVKGWSRLKKEALIRGDFEALPELSWSTARKLAAQAGSDAG